MACPLLNLPLELRHRCFEYVAGGGTSPKKLLRQWFEKEEVKNHVPHAAAHDQNNDNPRPMAPVSPSRKWRYIPRFLYLTHRPPPLSLLLTCKQLNSEAHNCFYNIATLHIDATASFAHTTFFEEAFEQLALAENTVLQHIRRIEVLVSWDTSWLRAEETGTAAAIFPAMLRQRVGAVYLLLMGASEMKRLLVRWHDSAQDEGARDFRTGVLEPLRQLDVLCTVREYYVDVDGGGSGRVARQRRDEFQKILERGLDRLR